MIENKDEKYKSRKIQKGIYNCPIPKRKIAINVETSLSICKHKGRWIVALTKEGLWRKDRTFKQNETINRTQALKMIQFLTDYVNLVRPTEATSLNASIKISSNRIKNSAAQLTGMAIKAELGGMNEINR